MTDFQIDIRQIENQDGAKLIADVFLDSALDEKGLRKELVQNFFTSVLNNLESQSVSPKTKFFTLFILRELSLKDKATLKIFGTFATHPLYNYLQELAVTIDPKKPVSQKGKSYFPSDKQLGNDFMRLLLQSLVSWGIKFPNNSKKEPTKFKKTLNRLNDQKVVLPKQFIFYQSNEKKSQQSYTPQGPKQATSSKGVSNDKISNPTISMPSVKQSKDKHGSQIKFMYNKIQGLLSILQDSEQVEEIQKEIQSYHMKFEKDLQKLQSIQSQMIESTDEELVKLYFKVFQFFNQQRQLYKNHALKNQYDVYISGYTITYDKIFQEKNQKDTTFKQQPSISKNISEQKNKAKLGLPPQKPSKQKITSQKSELTYKQGTEKENITSKISQKQKKDNTANRDSRFKQNIVQTCFRKLQKYSKSPHQGFGSIAKSLQKEKKTTTLASRLKTSNVTQNKSKYNGGASNLSKSVSKLKGIFAAPPNTKIKNKNYQGEQIFALEQLQNQIQSVRKEQGSRRLKASFFKKKYILFENTYIQVGFKCSPFYQKIEKFQGMLDIELYFGNVSSSSLTNFQLSFQGDKQSLIYTNPQVVESFISPSSQIKLELLNIPKQIPFGLISMEGSFSIQGERRNFTALLPNSYLQMTSYFSIKNDQFETIWGQSIKHIKSQPFKLSHHFPPNQLTHLIPQLRQNTTYRKFSQENSTTDYQLVAEIILEETYQGILRIIVRPDLTVVLQAGLYGKQPRYEQSIEFYLQSLRGALKEQDF